MRTFYATICFISLLFFSMFLSINSVHAQGGSLNITEVIVDFDTETITIIGEDLDYGGALIVTLGDLGSLNVSTETPTMIVVDFPAGGLLNGDYLLTVSRGNSPNQNDEYDLTIGAVGPPGPPGSAFDPCGLCPCNYSDVPKTTACWGAGAGWSNNAIGNVCSISNIPQGVYMSVYEESFGVHCYVRASCIIVETLVEYISPIQNWACRLCLAEYAHTLNESPDIRVGNTESRPYKCVVSE